jgi:hypothetical protein
VTLLSRVGVFILLIFACCPVADAVAAAFIKAQTPCQSCVTIRPEDASKSLRTFVYQVPGPGRSLVTFHGDMFCVNFQQARAVVDLTSQIIVGTGATPSLSGPSGLRHAVVLKPSADNTTQPYDSFNLTSRRALLHTAAGSVTVSLKILRNRMDPFVFCNTDNASFSVVFFPNGSTNGVIVGQSPCVNSSGYCSHFSAGESVPAIRSLTFNAPGKGSALVRMHGTLYCANNAGARGTIDVDSAIVDSATAAARPDLPGGLKHRIVLESPAGFGASDSFNLSSTRVVNFSAAGVRHFYFRITPRQMSPGTTCWVYNAAFSVVYVRSPGPFAIRSNATCTTSAHWCDAFGRLDPISKLPFNAVAPGKGYSEITFNGSAVCQSENAQISGIFLTTQIVTGNPEFPSSSGPGGLAHNQRLESASASDPVADTFDFSSTRVLAFNAAATKPVNFLTSANMAAQQRCYLYSGGFASLFVPE